MSGRKYSLAEIDAMREGLRIRMLRELEFRQYGYVPNDWLETRLRTLMQNGTDPDELILTP